MNIKLDLLCVIYIYTYDANTEESKQKLLCRICRICLSFSTEGCYSGGFFKCVLGCCRALKAVDVRKTLNCFFFCPDCKTVFFAITLSHPGRDRAVKYKLLLAIGPVL